MTSTVNPDLKYYSFPMTSSLSIPKRGTCGEWTVFSDVIPNDLLTFNTKERNLWGMDRITAYKQNNRETGYFTGMV